MELSNLSFKLVEQNGYKGLNDLYDVLLFLKEQKGLSFEVVKNPKGTWNGFVRKDVSEETLKEFGHVEPRIIFRNEINSIFTEEDAIDLLISYYFI